MVGNKAYNGGEASRDKEMKLSFTVHLNCVQKLLEELYTFKRVTHRHVDTVSLFLFT
jgi:hypothetical protein